MTSPLATLSDGTTIRHATPADAACIGYLYVQPAQRGTHGAGHRNAARAGHAHHRATMRPFRVARRARDRRSPAPSHGSASAA